MNETSVVSGTDYASLLDEVAETMECPNIRVWISLFLDETLEKTEYETCIQLNIILK